MNEIFRFISNDIICIRLYKLVTEHKSIKSELGLHFILTDCNAFTLCIFSEIYLVQFLDLLVYYKFGHVMTLATRCNLLL